MRLPFALALAALAFARQAPDPGRPDVVVVGAGIAGLSAALDFFQSLGIPAALGVARFSFADLCEAPLGTHDYQHLAHAFHTLMIDGIPVLGPERRNAARRFVLLIDALYDNGVGLIASADAEPQALCPGGDSADGFARTASRLTEMRSETYLAERHGHGGAARRPL